MTVADLISILQKQDPRALVVVPDSDYPDPNRIHELLTYHVRPCAIKYPHPNRAPRFAGEYADKNAIYLCTLPPPTGSTL
jgi:hypothetical protein